MIVVGGGNAAMCAALSAREQGAKVLVLERAPQDKRGGNSAFTGGGFRMVHHGAEDIKKVVPDLTEQEIANTDFGEYTAEQYLDDLGRITQYHIDPDLAEMLVAPAAPTPCTGCTSTACASCRTTAGRRSSIEGRFKFFGGSVIYANGGGAGLVEAQYKNAERSTASTSATTRAAWRCCAARSGVEGVRVDVNGVRGGHPRASAVVLACGGFEANREWRTRYLGPGLGHGQGARHPLQHRRRHPHGARHRRAAVRPVVGLPLRAPGSATPATSASVETRHNGYPPQLSVFGIMVNADGKRFLDEGADFRNFTYAKYGRVVLQQPGSYAWQVFDAQAKPLMRDEYKLRGATKVTADTLEELVKRMQDVDPAQFLETVREYNAAIKRDVPFNPNIKDGRARWASQSTSRTGPTPIEKPPFEAYSVGCGITFTFGGLKIDNTGRVLDIEDAPLPGLYAAGELVGGIFYFNYPGRDGADVIGGVRAIGGTECGGIRESVVGHAKRKCCVRPHPLRVIAGLDPAIHDAASHAQT